MAGTIPRLTLMSVAISASGVWSGDSLGADDSNQTQTVLVMANRTAENVRDVPMDVSVVSAALASAAQITDTQTLAAYVPGLLFNRQANTAIPFIRGVGSPTGESGDEPSVAFYVDDVYEPAAQASLANFNSIERIEVEKGPQGTVFGRNATGGVVQVFTRDPSRNPGLVLDVGVANYDTKSASLYTTGPLASTLAANVSLYAAQQNDGWGHNILTGGQVGTGWGYGGRVKLLWTPSERTSAVLNLDYDDTRTEEGVNVRAFQGTASFNPTGPPLPAPPGYYDTNAIPPTHSITYQSGVSLKVIHDVDWSDLTSITAWRHTKAVEGVDEDSGIELADAVVTTQERTWTQEFRLTSAPHSTTSWIAGLYYFHDVAGYDPLYLYGYAFLPYPSISSFGIETTSSWAAFAQTKWEILPRTDLTLGARYTTDHRELDASAAYPGEAAIPAVNSPQSASWSKPTYRAVLDHHLTDELMAYIGYNRGFKSGLFNPIVVPGAAIDPPVAPEILDSYTAGAKSEFLSSTLRVDVEGFYYRYNNIQVQEIVSGATHITNAAGATIRGVDLDVTSAPVAHFSITASVEVLSGHYTSFQNGQFYVYNARAGGNCLFEGAGTCSPNLLPPNYSTATNSWNLGGNHTVETPPFSSSLTVQKEIPSVVGEFSLLGNWTHTGNYHANADNGLGQVAPSSPENDKQGRVNLLNASVTWNSLNHRWQIRAWGKNLTGVPYWSYAQENAFQTQYAAAPPRTFGVTCSGHW